MRRLQAYFHYCRGQSSGSCLMVAFVFAVGVVSKPVLVTLAFVLLLLDYWPLGRIKRQRPDIRRQLLTLAAEKIPLIALSAVSGVITFLAQRHAIGWTEQLPMLARINNAIVTYVIYVRQMFLPVNLAVFYPHPENRLPPWEIALALAVLISITSAAVILPRKAPYFLTGGFWYLGMLVPVIGLV